MKCEICEKVFSSKNSLTNYYNIHHNSSGKEYRCNVCTKRFQTQRDLTIHVKTVHGGKKHNCLKCGNFFS